MDLGTRLTIFLRGRLVGNDAVGNRYYLEKSQRRGRLRARRWWYTPAKRMLRRCWWSGTAGCIIRLTSHCRKLADVPGRSHIFQTRRARPWPTARRATTTAAVIEPHGWRL